MLQKFAKAVAMRSRTGFTLVVKCINGAEVTTRMEEQVGPDTRYADGTALLDTDELLFSYDKDGRMIEQFYPYGDPQGDPTRLGGGKGKGHLMDVVQRVTTSYPYPGPVDGTADSTRSSLAVAVKPDFGTEGRGIGIQWINGMVHAGVVFTIMDPSISELPNGTDVFFHASLDEDGNMVVEYIAKSEGNAADPG